jgi:hypothetical protein
LYPEVNCHEFLRGYGGHIAPSLKGSKNVAAALRAEKKLAHRANTTLEHTG